MLVYDAVTAGREEPTHRPALRSGVAAVVNLAAQAGVRYSIENPDVYIESNIMGFYNILEACRHNPVEHLVYASSSSVYGNDALNPEPFLLWITGEAYNEN